MNIDQLNIAVLMGGPGSERDVSLSSGRAVLEALKEEGLNAYGLEVDAVDPEIPEKTDLVFNVIHGTYGEDGGLQQYLEAKGIPYTGAGAKSSELAFDKVEAKKRFVEAGVPTPKSEIISTLGEKVEPSFQPPFVVKPPREGSSVGVRIVKSAEEAPAALEEAARYGDEILVEQFVEGRELTVAVIDGKAFPVVEIIPEGGWYDMKTKYPQLYGGEPTTQYFCPAQLSKEETAVVQKAAVEAYRSLGIEIYARVDVLLDSNGNPYVLEANTIPGMTASSLLPKSAAEAGIPFGALCRMIADLSYGEKRG